MAVNNRPAGDSFGRKVLAEWPILLVLAVFGFEGAPKRCQPL